MKDMEFTVQEIKELMESFHKNRLGSLRLSQNGFSLELEGPRVEQVVGAAPMAPALSVPIMAEPLGEEAPAFDGSVVNSPIVGTFYAAPAPDKEPYVKVGTQVKKGDVLFIIESMKLMNEVTSELDGTVTQILVENAQAVEYGQPILCIK